MCGQLEEPHGCRGPAAVWCCRAVFKGVVVFLLFGAFKHAVAPPGQIRQSVSAAQSQLHLQGKHCAILRRPCQTADPTKIRYSYSCESLFHFSKRLPEHRQQ